MANLIPKIVYRLYGIKSAILPENIAAEDSIPIPYAPEFDSYSNAVSFYTDTMLINPSFYNVGPGEFFKHVFVGKSIILLPHGEDEYSNESYTADLEEL